MPRAMSFDQTGGLTGMFIAATALAGWLDESQMRTTKVRLAQGLLAISGTMNRMTLLVDGVNRWLSRSGAGLIDSTGRSESIFHPPSDLASASNTRTMRESTYFLCTKIWVCPPLRTKWVLDAASMRAAWEEDSSVQVWARSSAGSTPASKAPSITKNDSRTVPAHALILAFPTACGSCGGSITSEMRAGQFASKRGRAWQCLLWW